ncbi:hypothetical protein K3G63_03280 [Hymenobacter sp. HSC-4F20]|uniref:hypothetical protein n=1 Tax=Hymenobacter sp. HSC-4F20 TaxID=2864135 RepID=UPI001C7359BC|nr:hypothetical protein [Hymenobacter sp. HSC-4F20]MBX0289441.1 hypothetical protein [Hymenobacter sp. HSC-4F20]
MRVTLQFFYYWYTLENMSAWTWSKNLFSLALLMIIAFFLLRSSFTRRPAAPVAEMPVE